jgi:hypothetical protein
MPFENIDNLREPRTDEFEKLEFLPEQLVSHSFHAKDASDDTAQIVFDPGLAGSAEPPVSFDIEDAPEPPDEPEIGFLSPQSDDLDLEASTPFELFGTSLFGDSELDTDEFDTFDEEDDLEF